MSKTYNKFKEAFGHYQAGYDEIKKATAILGHGPTSYYIEKVEGYVNALFEVYAPFKVGDRVMIIDDIHIGPGWESCRHFLVVGQKGYVQDVDYVKYRFTADVVFDNETWIDSNGDEQPVTDKHCFHLSEHVLKRIAQP